MFWWMDTGYASVGPHTGKTPAGYRVIEAPNSTVLPGLWENHAHPDSDDFDLLR